MTAYIELAVGWLFANSKGHDAKAFIISPAFSSHKSPTIHVTSPELGDSSDGAHLTLSPDYMYGGEGRLPSLKWDTVEGVEEWLLISEDVDAPLSTPICHG